VSRKKGKYMYGRWASKLPIDEEKRLLKLAFIPTVISMIPYLIKIVELFKKTDLTLWEYWTKVGISLMFFSPAVFFISFEVLYHIKIRGTLKFHALRIIGALSTIIFAVSVFSFTMFIAHSYIEPMTGIGRASLIGFWLAIPPLAVFAYKTRHLFRRLEMGEG